MTSTRPVSSTPGAATTSTAHGSAPPESEAAARTRPAEVLEHRARGQLGILGVLGLCAAVCLWVVWRTGPGKVRALDLAEATARVWPTIAVRTGSQYILRQPLGQLLYRLLPVHGTNICYAAGLPPIRRWPCPCRRGCHIGRDLSGRAGQIGGDHAANCTPGSDSTPGLGSGFAPS